MPVNTNQWCITALYNLVTLYITVTATSQNFQLPYIFCKVYLYIAVTLYITVTLSQSAKKIIFTAYHSGKLKLALTSPDVISTSPQNFLFFCYSNSS